MIYSLNKFLKAAPQNAAFFILLLLICAAALAKPMIETLASVRTKASTLLLQKQKKQALQAVIEFIRNESNKNPSSEAYEFLELVAKTFTGKESQESYETSVALVVEDPKEAIRQAEICLQADPQNSECLVQRIRLAYRNKNASAIQNYLNQIKLVIPGTKTDIWVSLATRRNEIDFKGKSIVKRLSEKPNEDTFVLASLELDRSFAAKNFSRAKEVIFYLEKNYPDWPDIIYYKLKIETESAEEKNAHTADALALYSAKCKNLSKSIARKYRYDFDLCRRGTI